MYSTTAVVVAKEFSETSEKPATVDKHGKYPIILVPVAGKIPNRQVISGTVADREGFSINQTYMVQVIERESDAQYGRQFTFTNLGQLGGVDVIKAAKELGEASVFNIDANLPEGRSQVEEAQRQEEISQYDEANAGEK